METLTITDIIQEIIEDLKGQIERKNDEFRTALEIDSSSCSSSDSSSSNDTNNSDCLVNDIRKKMKKLDKKSKKVRTNQNVDEESENEEEDGQTKTITNQKYLKTKGELTIDDLEPVTRLNIQLSDSVKLIKMGRVISIVDEKLVVIQSLLEESESCKPLNEETILFDSNRQELGKIFEIFGPVQAPFYSIRFNSKNDIKDNGLNIEKGEFIYYANDSKEYTKFIFNVDELRSVKGSDASWNNDNEPPVEFIDYSDDEQEQFAKKIRKQKRINARKGQNSDDSDSDSTVVILPDGSTKMNQRNSKRTNIASNTKMMRESTTNGFLNNNNNNNNNRNNQRMPFSKSFHGMPNQQMENLFMQQMPNQFNPQYNMMQQQQQQQGQFHPMQNYNQHWQRQPNQGNYFNNYHNNGQYPNQFNQQNPYFNQYSQYPPQNPNFIQNNQFQGYEQNQRNYQQQQQQQQQQQPYQMNMNQQNIVDKRFIQDSNSKTNLIKKSF